MSTKQQKKKKRFKKTKNSEKALNGASMATKKNSGIHMISPYMYSVNNNVRAVETYRADTKVKIISYKCYTTAKIIKKKNIDTSNMNPVHNFHCVDVYMYTYIYSKPQIHTIQRRQRSIIIVIIIIS